MRKHTQAMIIFTAVAFLSLYAWGTGITFANTTITLEQPAHFTTAEGSDVVLNPGEYMIEPAEEWLRVTPGEGQAVDALLLEAQSATHEESLTAPLALSAPGEQPDTHHLALLLPNGKRLEAIGSYSGLRRIGFFAVDREAQPQHQQFSTSSLSSFGSLLGVIVNGGQRQMTINVLNILRISVYQTL